MLRRIFRGQGVVDREDDFIAVVRRRVLSDARETHGLVAFMAASRRVDLSDHFALISCWPTVEDIAGLVGDPPNG